jgi:FMN-dependent NADH-azoreductase
MKRLLYITANSKAEELSASKTVGRRAVGAIMQKVPDALLEEVDLYGQHIPQVKSCYFAGRSALADKDVKNALSPEEQTEVDKAAALCDQFRSADYYVLAAPMWNLSFPAPVKSYIDCIVQVGRTIEFVNNRPRGLLKDKPRAFLYVQSSGAGIPWLLRPALNKGLNYVCDIVNFLGIDNFEELLVDGTGTTEPERLEAIQNATEQIDSLVERLLIR